MSNAIRVLVFAAVVGVFPVASSGQAGGKSDAKVKASASATPLTADGKQKVTITLDVEKGWYIYANPLGGNAFANEFMGSNRTNVLFRAKGKVVATTVFPKGKFKSEAIGKDTAEFHIYQDRVTIESEVQRTGGDSSELVIQIDVNACRIGKKGTTEECLPQGSIVVKVP